MAPRSTDDTRVWHWWQIGPRHGAASIAIYVMTRSRHHHHLHHQRDPLTGEDGRCSSWTFFSPIFLFLLFLLYLLCTLGPSLVYKQEGWVPHLGEVFSTLRSTSTPLHQRLGISSLSRQFVTPAANFRAGNTSNLKLDVRTFNLNQYNLLCLLSSPSRPNTQYKFTHRWYETPTVGAQGRGFCAFQCLDPSHGWLATA
jgi:hypothetical protein